jgi:hypothetical protein
MDISFARLKPDADEPFAVCFPLFSSVFPCFSVVFVVFCCALKRGKRLKTAQISPSKSEKRVDSAELDFSGGQAAGLALARSSASTASRPCSSLRLMRAASSFSGSRRKAWFHWNSASVLRPTRQ